MPKLIKAGSTSSEALTLSLVTSTNTSGMQLFVASHYFFDAGIYKVFLFEVQFDAAQIKLLVYSWSFEKFENITVPVLRFRNKLNCLAKYVAFSLEVMCLKHSFIRSGGLFAPLSLICVSAWFKICFSERGIKKRAHKS